MIVSWNWLKEYVKLDMSVDALTERLTMSGLNLESVSDVEGDIAIDLEVTSNRADCLGHLGIAREVSVLFGKPLAIPEANVSGREIAEKTTDASSVSIRCEDLCPRYSARLIQGVKVGPSPSWLARRLTTLGINLVNNVVDVTNYVLMECGQPLHAFDFRKLHGGKIVVRRAERGEKLVAIDQREYELQPEMCIIADADHPVAVAGVMGGLETEISVATTDVLIEVAEFAPMTVRNTARHLNLHSPSSYRFERGVDATQLDWASRRCASLILELAGGRLSQGAASAGSPPPGPRAPIVLRFSQIERILGISIPAEKVGKILQDLGLSQVGAPTKEKITLTPPSWRRDLSREIDLIEEAARIHGYEQIPEDVPVPLAVSSPPLKDRVSRRVSDVLIANGFFEAVTLSFVTDELFELFRPWGEIAPLRVEHSSRRRENILRQSLVPSLLFARRENERHGNFDARLFEISKGYLAAAPERKEAEPVLVSVVSEQSFREVKGIVEGLARRLNRSAQIAVRPVEAPHFQPGRGCEVLLDGKLWGWMGEIAVDVREKLDLRDPVTVAELNLAGLEAIADLNPVAQPLPQFPASERDLNFVLDEAITWQELAEVVRKAAGPLLESLSFGGLYRGQQIPADKKSYVVTLQYRSNERTLTNQEIDAAQKAVIEACESKLGAKLR